MSQATIGRTPGGARRQGGAGGRRLAAAFDSVSSLPALAEAQRRLLGACDHGAPSANELADVVESDAALAIAVMRAANNGAGRPGGAAGVRDAVEALRADGVRTLVAGIDTYDLLEHPGVRTERYERFRRHAVSVRAAAERIAELARLPQPDQLALGALLHDVGRPVLAELHGDEYLDDRRESPEDRVRRERLEVGMDHALVGAVLLRRWSVPNSIAAAIERHHSPDATDHAAAIRLADLIVHHAAGDVVSTEAMRQPAAALGIDADALNGLIFDFPHSGGQRRRASEPCPLSVRELDALRGLAEGKVYKQIAHELSLSVSTVRTHLHNVYRKIGAVDRAQAVLIARDRGWL